MLAKIINGELSYAPKNYKTDDGRLIINFNVNEDLMRYYGYKDIVDIRPTYNEETQYIRVAGYEDGEAITINYDVVDKQISEPEITLEERVTLLENQSFDQLAILKEEVNKVE